MGFFFVVQNKSCERARAASAQPEPQGRSPSSPPAPTGPRPAASAIRVACGSPDVRVACGSPDS
jgi:hypothetical protein